MQISVSKPLPVHNQVHLRPLSEVVPQTRLVLNATGKNAGGNQEPTGGSSYDSPLDSLSSPTVPQDSYRLRRNYTFPLLYRDILQHSLYLAGNFTPRMSKVQNNNESGLLGDSHSNLHSHKPNGRTGDEISNDDNLSSPAGNTFIKNNDSEKPDQSATILTESRDRVFYGRDWIFEKILKCLCRPAHKNPPIKSCEGNGLSTITSMTTADPKVSFQSATGRGKCRQLLVVGGPGSGKTSICRQIVRWRTLLNTLPSAPWQTICAQVSSHLIASHFCSTQCRSSLDIHSFVKSIRDQLLAPNCPLSKRMKKIMTDNDLNIGQWLTYEVIAKCPEQSFFKGIVAALNIFQDDGLTCTNENSKDFSFGKSSCLLLVDGIDEFQVGLDWRQTAPCSYGDREPTDMSEDRATTIISLLAKYADHLPSWFSLLLTCRRQNRSHVQRLFPCTKRVSIDDLHKPTVGQDIQQYILARIKREDRLQTALRDYFSAEVLSLLRIKSSACMLYLETVLDMISDQRMTAHHLVLIPGTLNGLYLWICQNLPYSETNVYASRQHQFERLKAILNVLLVSPGVLTEQELYRVLATSSPSLTYQEYQHQLLCLRYLLVLEDIDQRLDQDDICPTDISQSLAGDQGVVKVVQFNHTSFSEWILDIKHCTHTFLCDISKGEVIIRQALKLNTLQTDLTGLTPGITNHFIQLLMKTSSYVYWEPEDDQSQEERQCHVRPDQILSPLDCGEFLKADDDMDSIDPEMAHQSGDKTGDKSELPSQGHSTNLVEEPDALVIAVRRGRMIDVATLLGATQLLDIDQLDEDGWSALRTAAWRGHASILNLLLSHGAYVNLTGGDGRSALRAAAWSGHEVIVRRLLEAGADVDQEDAEGRTPLIAAAYMGHAMVVEMLAQAGANLNHTDEDGRTALHVAAFCVKSNEMAYHDVVSCLLEYGASVNIADNEGVTPLLGAARLGNRDVCELCLEADTDVNQTDRLQVRGLVISVSYASFVYGVDTRCTALRELPLPPRKVGNTALMLAVLNGHVDVVRLLLFWGGAVDVMDSSGRSLLCIASFMGDPAIVHELITRGLDEAHRDHRGCTPLHLAVIAAADAVTPCGPIYDPVASTIQQEGSCPRSVKKYCEVIWLLLDSGASLEVTDNSGRTPLLIACETNQLEVVKTMLTAWTPVNDGLITENPVCNGDSLLPREGPAGGNSSGPTDFFYSASPPPEALNQACMEGQTPLRLTALAENFELTRLLLSAGADPDQQDSYGRTTLYLLALEGMLEMADLFLHTPSPGARKRPNTLNSVKGANPVLSDDEGRCPLHVATWQGHLKMVRLLLKVGTPVDIRDREGRTPLQLAAWQGHADICSSLLKEGNARVDAVCSQGATSLCIAAQEGNIDVCRVLLQAGANPYQLDGHGRTPYRVASKAGHVAICRLLDSSCNAPSELGQASQTDSNLAIGKQLQPLTAVGDKRSPYLHQQIAAVGEQPRAVNTPVSPLGVHYSAPAANQPVPAEASDSKATCEGDAGKSNAAGLIARHAYQDEVNPYAKPVGPVLPQPPMHQTSQSRLYNPLVVASGQQTRLAQLIPWQPLPVCSAQLPQVVDPTAIQLVAAYQPGASFQMDPQKICFVPMVNCPATAAISPLQTTPSVWSYQQYKEGVVPLVSDRPFLVRDGFAQRDESIGPMPRLGEQASHTGASQAGVGILNSTVIDSSAEGPLYEFQDSRFWPSNLQMPNAAAPEWGQLPTNQCGHRVEQAQMQLRQHQTPVANPTNQSRSDNRRSLASTSRGSGRTGNISNQVGIIGNTVTAPSTSGTQDPAYRQKLIGSSHTGSTNVVQTTHQMPASVATAPLQNVNKFASSTKSAIAGMFGLKSKWDRRAHQKATSPLRRQVIGQTASDQVAASRTPEIASDPPHKCTAAVHKMKEALPPKPPPHRQGRINKWPISNQSSTQQYHSSMIARQLDNQPRHCSPQIAENPHDGSVRANSPAIHGNESRILHKSAAMQRRTDYPEMINSPTEAREQFIPADMNNFNPFNRSRSHPCPTSP